MSLLISILVNLPFFPPQGCVAVTVIIGIIILVKIFWDGGKSGSYYTHENTTALKFHDSL